MTTFSTGRQLAAPPSCLRRNQKRGPTRWEQTFADALVAQAVRHIVEPANEQNLDRLSVEGFETGNPQ